MPNGKPGDHPITDILLHNIRVFSRKADRLIREICNLGGRDELEAEIDLLRPPQIRELERILQELRDRLKREGGE
ncbi:hypothetical protein E3J38_06445 [candidate division TA06 bacterium]|uniref:Uncharacterized protein n=1 Tax=candidate division TA06 bacterium TaxID=2250710 RepID=A0A523XM40_UNCT6|nr:MAG: hypothetical protein E3J38_06445 [candidate division TA06 bacterium]